MTSELIEAALAWHDAGASVLPAGAGKFPAKPWKDHQTARLSASELTELLVTGRYDGIGLVTGFNGFEMFELEGRAMHLVTPLLAALPTELGAKLITYWETTPKGGYHFVYRVADEHEQDGSVKLARMPDDAAAAGWSVTIETRGRYGWTVLAPSGGNVHDEIPDGQWQVFRGSPGVVPTLTMAEREILFDAARSLDEMPAPPVIEHRAASTVVDGELTPGQDFEQRADWMADLLGPLGWTVNSREGEKTFLTRPGKKFGKSATLNYDGNDNLYVFTSSTDFPEMTSWTKFGAYAHLHHGDDFKAAARELRKLGYGSPSKASTAQAESRATLSLIQGGGGPTTSGANALAPEEKSSPARRYELNDRGNARRLIDIEGQRLRYSPERKQWIRWDGHRWSWESDDSAAIYAVWQLVELAVPADEAEQKWLEKSSDLRFMVRAVNLARSDPAMKVHMSELDAYPYELNAPNGVIDLRTSEVSAPDPDKLHTRITGVEIGPEATCPRWEAFLAETFSGDVELIEFVQRLAGYSATGKVTHHVLPFLYGGGANGKSVFLEVLMAVLGSYAGPVPADFLLAGANVHESYTADLAGMRLVVCSEVGPTAKFHEQKIKHLTGGDQVKARFLYGKPFTFDPSHHMWLMGNHQPRVDAGGESFWRRLRLVPFDHTVPESERIEGLAAQLVKEEGPAILAWIIEGARKQLSGLAEPESVKAATSSYAEDEDHLGRFIEERVKFGGADYVRMSTADMRHAYEQWCFAEGEPPIPANVFGRELKQRGAGITKSNGRRFYTNVTLMKPEDSLVPQPEQMRFRD